MKCKECGADLSSEARFCPYCGASASDDVNVTREGIVSAACAPSPRGSGTVQGDAMAYAVAPKVHTPRHVWHAAAPREGLHERSYAGICVFLFALTDLLLLAMPWVNLDSSAAAELGMAGFSIPNLFTLSQSESLAQVALFSIQNLPKGLAADIQSFYVFDRMGVVYVLWAASFACLVYGCVRIFIRHTECGPALLGMGLGVLTCTAFAIEFALLSPALEDQLSHIMMTLSPFFLACAIVSAAGLLAGLYLVRTSLTDSQA